MPLAVSSSLLAALGENVAIQASPAQQSFEFDSTAIGTLVSATVDGVDVFGILRKETAKGMVIDNFGLLHTATKINAAIQLDGDWELGAKVYAKGMAGGVPTWRDLIEALAHVGDGTTLDRAVVDYALDQYGLPEEAGANG